MSVQKHLFFSTAVSVEIVTKMISCEFFRCHSCFHKIQTCHYLDVASCKYCKIRDGYCLKFLLELVGLTECRNLRWKRHT